MKLYEKKRRSSKNMMKHSWIKINEPYKLPINELLFKNTFTIEISLRTKRKKNIWNTSKKIKNKKNILYHYTYDKRSKREKKNQTKLVKSIRTFP